MKVAFYCKLSGVKTKNLDDIDSGNPGMGGTEYLFLLVVRYLKIIYEKEDFEVILLTDTDLNITNEFIPTLNVGSLKGGVKWCSENHVDCLVLRSIEVINLDKEDLTERNFKYILWAHNTVPNRLQKMIERYGAIKALVCVSKAQYDNMSDSICFEKCCYINNGLPHSFFNQSTRTDMTEKIAVFIGAIVPQKGLHNLLAI